MPSRAKKLDRAVANLPSIPKELVAQFLTGPMTGEAINAAGIAFKQALIMPAPRRPSHSFFRPDSLTDAASGSPQNHL